MAIKFIAIVNSSNDPVYFRSAPGTPERLDVNHQFIAEMALDFAEQQAAQLESDLSSPLMVVSHDGVAVYAMLANTRTKYLIGVDSLQEPPDVGAAMWALSDAYVGYQTNPFKLSGPMIKSPKFDERIEQIISQSSSPLPAEQESNIAVQETRLPYVDEAATN